MPATLKSITSKTNTIAVRIDDDPAAITVTYSTRRVTPRMLQAIQEGINSGSDPLGLDSVTDQLLAMVTAWDLRPDEGEPVIPLEKEALKDVPLEILSAVVEAIGNDQSPKGTTDGSSNTP